MNKTLVTVVLIVLVAAFIQDRKEVPPETLQLYQQVDAGKVDMIGEVTDQQDIEQYDDMYKQLVFDKEVVPSAYPDVAVYRMNSNGLIHHANVWLDLEGAAYVQQQSGDRKLASLHDEEKKILQKVLTLEQ